MPIQTQLLLDSPDFAPALSSSVPLPEGASESRPDWLATDLADLPVLTIIQPWATSVVYFGKDVENRGWTGLYLKRHLGMLEKTGNRFLIHAAKSYHADQVESWREMVIGSDMEPTDSDLAAAGVQKVSDLPRGGIIGTARMESWVSESESPWFVGPYALKLVDVTPLPFVACKGAQGLWFLPSSLKS